MTKERQDLIDKFQKWLDTNPREQIIAAQCATIAQKYAEEYARTIFTHSMNGDEMNSIEFFDMIKKEWCVSEEQYRPFWNDVLTFARKYHKERNKYR